MGFSLFAIGLYVILIIDSLNASESAVNLFAVSGFKGLGPFYYQLNVNNPLGPDPDLGCKKREHRDKKQICRSIFSSFHFDYQHETLVEPSHWQIRQELKHHYRTLYKEMFIDPEKPQFTQSIKKKKCLNPRSVHDVTPGNDRILLKEDVFKCLVRENQSGAIKQYFVSREYNLNGDAAGSTNSDDYIAGRFVFEHTSGDPLSLHALAEQPAYIPTEGNVELVYMRMKGDRKLTNDAEDDPVCRLTSGEKFRLCSTILHSTVYGRKVKFWPGSSSVGFDCKRKVIELRTNEAKQLAADNDVAPLEEWVISCHAMSRYTNAWKTYYISRGYASKNAFVYKFFNGKLTLERRSIEVKLLRDGD